MDAQSVETEDYQEPPNSTTARYSLGCAAKIEFDLR